MKDMDEIHDDEIRIIGEETVSKRTPGRWRVLAIVAGALLVVGGLLVALLLYGSNREDLTETYFEPEKMPVVEQKLQPLGEVVPLDEPGYIQMVDTCVNDIPMRLFIPHNAVMELSLGRIDPKDTTIVYVSQAADVRADNGGIVGAFVLKGKPLAWGLSKQGFCAAIGDSVVVGVADNTSYFEEAINRGGYFFRQYGLVKDGALVENKLKGKAIRRGICDRMGEIFMVETHTDESLHDFAQALVDIGVSQAVYIVGSSQIYGWAVDAAGVKYEFNDVNTYLSRWLPENTSYIVWRRK